jgi:hypothetical protein
MSKGSGTTRGDRRRNERRERLRRVLPRDGAVIGIDLAEEKQAIAVIDHDVRVLARKTVRVKTSGWVRRWTGPWTRLGRRGLSMWRWRASRPGRGGCRYSSCAPSGACRWCASSRWSPISPVSSRGLHAA